MVLDDGRTRMIYASVLPSVRLRGKASYILPISNCKRLGLHAVFSLHITLIRFSGGHADFSTCNQSISVCSFVLLITFAPFYLFVNPQLKSAEGSSVSCVKL